MVTYLSTEQVDIYKALLRYDTHDSAYLLYPVVTHLSME